MTRMNRRSFIKTSFGAFCSLTTLPVLSCRSYLPVRFGLITDLHYAKQSHSDNRYYSQSKQKLLDAVQVFNKSNLDFIIELGDFKDQDDQPDKRLRTITYLDEIENVMRLFHGPVYHVLGNHDMDSISKQDFLTHTKNHGTAEGKNYYSFVYNRLKFIVLDANYNEDGSDYNAGNFSWTKAHIPASQAHWLNAELSDSNCPVIVFVHQLLDRFSGMDVPYIINADEIVDILEKSKRVLAVFQGHLHEGNYSFRKGIHYFTMKAAVAGSLPENNCFATVEIDSALDMHVKGFVNCEDQCLKYSGDTLR